MYLAMKAQSLNHWTAGEFPVCEFKKKKKSKSLWRTNATFIIERAAKMAEGWVFLSQKRSKADTQVQEARIQMETEGTNSIRKWNGKDRKITPTELKVQVISIKTIPKFFRIILDCPIVSVKKLRVRGVTHLVYSHSQLAWDALILEVTQI